MSDGNTLGIIFATFSGPIAAVLVTRWIDRLRLKETRRLEVFRTMMRTRRMPLSADYVGAFNLLEIDFHNFPKVMAARKELLNHFEGAFGENKTLDEIRAANEKADSLRTSLLSAMAEALGYKFEQMAIHRGAYTPAGWGVEFDEQAAVRKGLAELMSGRRVLPVTVIAASDNAVAGATAQQQASPFPPKP